MQLQVQLREDPAAKSPALHRVRGASGREEEHQLAVRRILGLRIPGLDLLQSSKLLLGPVQSYFKGNKLRDEFELYT